MNFHTGIYDTTKDGHTRMIVNKDEIADTYWRPANFWVDAVSSIPFDVVGKIIRMNIFNCLLVFGIKPQLLGGAGDMNMNKLQFARLGKGLRAIKIVKVLRLLRYASQSRTMVEQYAHQGWTDVFKSNTFNIVRYYAVVFVVCWGQEYDK